MGVPGTPNGGDEVPLCSLRVVVRAQEGFPGGCCRVAATARHGSGRAGASSSHGRSGLRSGDRIAPAGPGLRRDRSPSALCAGVHGVRDGHHLVPVAGERDGRRRSDAGEEPPCQARPAALGGAGRDWAAVSVRKDGRCAPPGTHPRHGPPVAPRHNRRLERHPTPGRVAARTRRRRFR